MRAIAMLLLLLVSAVASRAEYVVLSGVESKDPYFSAAERIAKHHEAAPIVHFDAANPDSALAKLRELRPDRVAVVVRPEQIDVNSVRRFLKMAASVDDDPFVDFEYGFITGATADEALKFVDAIIRSAQKERPLRIGHAFVMGGDGPCAASDGEYSAGTLRLPEHALAFTAPDGKQGRDAKFIAAHLKELAGCGAVMMGGHGMPWEISSGPRAEDIAGVSLFPAVVFNYACYTGVTRRWPEEKWDGAGQTDRLSEIEAKRSFALSVIRAGASGYVAYVNPRPAGPELNVDFDRVLTGATMGESRRRDQDKIVLGYLGFGEKRIALGDVVDGATTPREKIGIVRNMMLDGATGGILYGDPALRPFPEARGALPMSTATEKCEGGIRLRMKLEANSVWTWGIDPFHQVEGGTAMKLVDRVELPRGFGEVAGVTVLSAQWGDMEVSPEPVLFAIEDDGGKRFLHVKVNFRYDEKGQGDIVVAVQVTAGK